MYTIYYLILGFRVRTRKHAADGHRRYVVMHKGHACETQTMAGGFWRTWAATTFRVRTRADRIRAKLGSAWQTVLVKVAVPVSPCCRENWHWETIGGMGIGRIVNGRKTYKVICSKCRKPFVLDAGKGDSL